ncbi:unnamed protein product [Allacma fusca]|uniref:Uncharacterized protein n=1 Tax=Allacma fusca TaxID=39272 RepID=A0A8J2NVN1_9HEXA|nr:unnamed protein product [Allacma fusca]
MDTNVAIDEGKTRAAMDLAKLRGTSVTNYRTRKNNLRRKLKKAQLLGGLEKLNELKRERMDCKKRKEFRKYLRIKSECDRIEAERERMRVECCKTTRASKKENKEEEEYFRVLFKSNPDVVVPGKLDSFVPDNRDLGIMGCPAIEDSYDGF